MMSSEILSQEEIDALLNSSASDVEPELDTAANSPEPAAEENYEHLLTDMEKDAIGEVCNIAMGSSATALSTLLNKRVEITTPNVEITTYGRIRSQYPLPFVVIDVKYTQGLEGENLLVIRFQDASVIADLMMGNDGANPPEILSDLHLSAVSEAMNQMMGSACTAMSSVLSQRIDITTPASRQVNLASETLINGIDETVPVVKVSFKMQIEDLVNSELMQIIPLQFSKAMVANLMQEMEDNRASVEAAATVVDLAGIMEQQPVAAPTVMNQIPPQAPPAPPMAAAGQVPPAYQVPAGVPPMPQGYPPSYPQGYGQGYPPNYGVNYNQPPMQGFMPPLPSNQAAVPVQPAQFPNLGPSGMQGEHGNINLIMDVPLQITVELGKTRKTIREILELGQGSVVELDKLAGEPVDLLVNGKLLAKGEVVVIDENFGVRVTDIVSPIERVTNLQ